jgi:hypothetical protein
MFRGLSTARAGSRSLVWERGHNFAYIAALVSSVRLGQSPALLVQLQLEIFSDQDRRRAEREIQHPHDSADMVSKEACTMSGVAPAGSKRFTTA